jgi:hypothetical protein
LFFRKKGWKQKSCSKSGWMQTRLVLGCFKPDHYIYVYRILWTLFGTLNPMRQNILYFFAVN